MKINAEMIVNINFLMNARVFVQGLFFFIFSHAILILLNECYVMALYFFDFSFIITPVGYWIPIAVGILFSVIIGRQVGEFCWKRNERIENQCILVIAVIMLLVSIIVYFIFSDKIYYIKEYIRWGDFSMEGFINTKKTDLIYFLLEKIFSLEITLGVILMYISFFIGYRKKKFKSFECQEESKFLDIKVRTY